MTADQTRPRRPEIGVSVVLWHEDRLLLIQRGKAPYAGRWSLPGGRLRFGEPLRAGAARELLEETGLTAEIGAIIDTVELMGNDGGAYHFVLSVFAATAPSGTATARDDAADIGWFTPAEIGEMRLAPGADDVVAKAIAGRRGSPSPGRDGTPTRGHPP